MATVIEHFNEFIKNPNIKVTQLNTRNWSAKRDKYANVTCEKRGIADCVTFMRLYFNAGDGTWCHLIYRCNYYIYADNAMCLKFEVRD